MKKSLFVISLILLMITALPVAYADVIAEPYDDFYEENIDSCVYEGKWYYANGAQGNVEILRRPDGGRVITAVPNATILYIQYICDYEGEEWGIAEFSVRGGAVDSSDSWGHNSKGWMRMEELEPAYDAECFMAEHKAELYQYQGGFDAFTEDKDIVIWQFPGSGKVRDAFWFEPDTSDLMYAYRDEEGREWGYYSYMYGMDDVWICMDDPYSKDIPMFGVDTTHLITAKGGNAGTNVIVIASILVAVVVLVTAALIFVIYRKSKQAPKAK